MQPNGSLGIGRKTQRETRRDVSRHVFIFVDLKAFMCCVVIKSSQETLYRLFPEFLFGWASG
jgi:hypothetical protein